MIGPNRLVFILLALNLYFKIIELNVLSLSIIQYIIAMKKTIDKFQKCTILQKFNNALNIYNELSTIFIYDLLIKLLVLVYKEENIGQL